MSSASEQFDQLQQKYGGLNTRIKRMIIAGILALIYAVLDILLIQPLMDEYGQLTKSIEKAKADSKKFAASMMNLQNQFGIDPTLSDQEQVDAMTILLQQVESEIIRSSSEFVAPDQMIGFVNELLQQSKDISLVHLEKMPVEKSTVTTLREIVKETAPAKKSAKNKVIVEEKKPEPIASENVYRYGIEIKLKGNYPAILDYVQKIENLPWRVFWETAEFDAKEFTESTATFNIYTMSLEQHWLTL